MLYTKERLCNSLNLRLRAPIFITECKYMFKEIQLEYTDIVLSRLGDNVLCVDILEHCLVD